MADWGLIQGLAEGIRGGLQGYRDAQKTAQELALKKRSDTLAMMKEGVVADPKDDSNLVYTPEMQKKKTYEADQYDANSESSKSARQQAMGLLKSAGVPNAEGLIPETATAKDLQGENALYGKAITGVYGMQGRQLSNDRMTQGLDIKRDSLNFRKEQAGSAAGQAVEHDPIVQQSKKTTNNLDRAMSLLDGKEPVTAKSFNIIQQDMINAMAPGGAATEGKVNRELINTFQENLNDVQLKFGNVKDLRKDQPQVVENLRNIMKQVHGDYQNALSQQVADLTGSYDNTTNQSVQKTIQQKRSRYGSGNTNQMGLIQRPPEPSGAAAIPEAEKQAALEFISKNPGTPKAAAMKKALGLP